MKRWLGWFVVSMVFVVASSYVWVRRHQVVAEVAARGDAAAPVHEHILPVYAEARDAQEMITVTGPMADYVSRQKSSRVETLPKVETLQSISHRVPAPGHASISPVGTSKAILQKTFRVVNTVTLPFEVPAHASNPQLRGTYRSPVKGGDTQSSESADVEFLLLNEKQYTDFLSGRSGDAIFSADAAQEVAAGLPPTLNEPATYYLVFRNNSRDTGKKLVEADFRVDF
jgi:hypothetical protein